MSPARAAAVAIACLAASRLPGAPAADSWPDFRGPGMDGHSAAKRIPLGWAEGKGVRWRVEVRGRGWSSPIVYGKQIWLTTATTDGRELAVLCIDRESGRTLLDRKLFTVARPEPISAVNSYASPSPVIGDGRVFVHFGAQGTACLDTKGLTTLWVREDLKCLHSVGAGSSPVLADGRLILTLDGTDTQYTVALDPKTGRTIWTASRNSFFPAALEGERRKSFNTPVIAPGPGGKPMLICPAATGVWAYDLADGHEIWRIRHGGYSNSSRTLLAPAMAYVGTGYDSSEMIAVRLGGAGDVTASHIAWRCGRNMPYKPSPILVDGLIYAVSDTGLVTCLDAGTGETVWRERIGGAFSASPLYACGRIYLFNEQGKTTVIKPGRTLEKLAENELADGCMASAAAIDGALFVRTKSALYRLEEP